jgi:uncharacterized protein DUF4382
MRRSAATLTLKTWRGAFFLTTALLLLVMALAFFLSGCGDTCFVFVSNPPNGTIGIAVTDPGAACGFAKPKGAMQVVARVTPACEACSDSNRVRSVFVTLRGIDLRSRGKSSEQASDWLALLPGLEEKPLSIDLIQSHPGMGGDVRVAERVLVPAGEYDLVRLRLVSDEEVAADPLTQQNPCPNAGRNCVVMQDGRSQPLGLGDSTPVVIIAIEEMNGSLVVTPESDNELLLEVTPALSAEIRNGVVRFLPGLVGKVRLGPVLPSNGGK